MSLIAKGFIGTITDIKYCIECNSPKSDKGVYCKSCSYKHRTRTSGLKYDIKVVNKGWIKKGQEPWHKGKKTGLEPWNKGLKGIHLSPTTEFKYINGNGYRNLLLRGELPQHCQKCLEEPGLKRLHVHHKDHNRKNNNLNNLEVLCRPCHLRHHGKAERVYVEGRKAV